MEKIWIVQPMTDGGLGFTITNQKGHPLVELTYASESEAKSAARNVQSALLNVVSVRPLI